ncbi:hypothetical protein [Motilibacter aurantiacus]|uniref:hypothetical protein n=1 Tax=Motilibacter aurantiacus TaxID=2714955 RepID=UPI00140AA956|nr:hypothetical protein [Motilibacter aurantiacus]NHC44532.1 hypothetical protein [Motilibacter aurantiacus]
MIRLPSALLGLPSPAPADPLGPLADSLGLPPGDPGDPAAPWPLRPYPAVADLPAWRWC